MYKNGLVATDKYPYIGRKRSCQSNVERMTEKIASEPVSLEIDGDEENLKQILATYGPVVIGMNATDSFIRYQGGVFYDPSCARRCEEMNHAVLLVGYGTDAEINADFWLIKNSYGPNWGEDGYIRIVRNHPTLKNNCNTACEVFYAEV
jgi:cathepsin L